MIIFNNVGQHDWKKLMAAFNDLTAAIAAQTQAVSDLTAAVMVAIPEINPVPGNGATEAQVAAAAAAVTANNQAVAAQIAAIVLATTAPVTPPPVAAAKA